MKYAILVLPLLAACGAPVARQAPAESCGAAEYQSLVGQDAAATLALPEPKRTTRPDEAATTDFIPNRITVQLDETDTIQAVTCG